MKKGSIALSTPEKVMVEINYFKGNREYLRGISVRRISFWNLITRRKYKMLSQKLKIIPVSVIFSLLFIFLLGDMTFTLQGIEFHAALEPSKLGITEVTIPPVGSITSQTHFLPINISLTVLNINIEALQKLIIDAPLSSVLAQDVKAKLQDIALIFVLHMLFLAGLGGMFGAVLISGKNVKQALTGSVSGLLVAVILVGTTYMTYKPEKLRTPEYHGALKAAPWAIDLAEKAFQRFNELGPQMQIIAANLFNVFEQIDKIKPIGQDTDDLLVLHVSDIHNNPAAHKFIEQIVESFPVDLVIDTGDITDYGTPIESRLLKGLAGMKIPYLFIPGNHDSLQTSRDLSKYPQVQVLTGGIVDVQGLRILTIADPASATAAIITTDPKEIAEAKMKLKLFWEEAPNKPNLLVIHNYALAEELLGYVPLILFGHTHQYTIREKNGSILVNAGTTGAAGLRGLQASKEIPYSVVLLHFNRDENNELQLSATDTIRLDNFEKGFILERKLFTR